ncbi:MAG: NnrS family protein [Thalassobaculaceae bacterium]|nr:NnrS family protein [Thalassobaculaceae bacterium]
MTNETRVPGRDLVIFSYGFRPFFLSAALFACVSVFCWMLLLDGTLELSGPFTPTDWHIHEMLFGYAAAVIAGFLFTAIPNWTGRAPKRGWPLVFLVVLWLAGRLATGGLLGLDPVGVMLVDLAFLFAIVTTTIVEIVAGRNWRNLMVAVPVMLLLGANLVFHLETQLSGTSDIGRRLGTGIIIFLIMLIGGRIVPSFTRNWLVKRNSDKLPVAMNRFDALCLLTGAGALLGWSVFPESPIAGGAMLGAACLQGVRLSRWQGVRTWASPLLFMLHVAYAFIPLGLAVAGAASIGWISSVAGVHLLGIGAIGGMTLAVMTRASLGHTGNKLEAGPLLSVAAGMIFSAALVRACFPDISVTGVTGVWIAAALWIAGFAIFALKIGPYLARTNRKPT